MQSPRFTSGKALLPNERQSAIGLMDGLLDFVGQSLGGDTQHVRVQAPPNQLAVAPKTGKVFAG
jgi:hypothetical protein